MRRRQVTSTCTAAPSWGAVVAARPAHCVEVLDACERLVAYHPEMELLSARRQVLRSDEIDEHPSSETEDE